MSSTNREMSDVNIAQRLLSEAAKEKDQTKQYNHSTTHEKNNDDIATTTTTTTTNNFAHHDKEVLSPQAESIVSSLSTNGVSSINMAGVKNARVPSPEFVQHVSSRESAESILSENEERLVAYLENNNVFDCLNEIVEKMIQERPENPEQYMLEHLLNEDELKDLEREVEQEEKEHLEKEQQRLLARNVKQEDLTNMLPAQSETTLSIPNTVTNNNEVYNKDVTKTIPAQVNAFTPPERVIKHVNSKESANVPLSMNSNQSEPSTMPHRRTNTSLSNTPPPPPPPPTLPLSSTTTTTTTSVNNTSNSHNAASGTTGNKVNFMLLNPERQAAERMNALRQARAAAEAQDRAAEAARRAAEAETQRQRNTLTAIRKREFCVMEALETQYNALQSECLRKNKNTNKNSNDDDGGNNLKAELVDRDVKKEKKRVNANLTHILNKLFDCPCWHLLQSMLCCDGRLNDHFTISQLLENEEEEREQEEQEEREELELLQKDNSKSGKERTEQSINRNINNDNNDNKESETTTKKDGTSTRQKIANNNTTFGILATSHESNRVSEAIFRIDCCSPLSTMCKETLLRPISTLHFPYGVREIVPLSVPRICFTAVHYILSGEIPELAQKLLLDSIKSHNATTLQHNKSENNSTISNNANNNKESNREEEEEENEDVDLDYSLCSIGHLQPTMQYHLLIRVSHALLVILTYPHSQWLSLIQAVFGILIGEEGHYVSVALLRVLAACLESALSTYLEFLFHGDDGLAKECMLTFHIMFGILMQKAIPVLEDIIRGNVLLRTLHDHSNEEITLMNVLELQQIGKSATCSKNSNSHANVITTRQQSQRESYVKKREEQELLSEENEQECKKYSDSNINNNNNDNNDSNDEKSVQSMLSGFALLKFNMLHTPYLLNSNTMVHNSSVNALLPLLNSFATISCSELAERLLVFGFTDQNSLAMLMAVTLDKAIIAKNNINKSSNICSSSNNNNSNTCERNEATEMPESKQNDKVSESCKPETLLANNKSLGKEEHENIMDSNSSDNSRKSNNNNNNNNNSDSDDSSKSNNKPNECNVNYALSISFNTDKLNDVICRARLVSCFVQVILYYQQKELHRIMDEGIIQEDLSCTMVANLLTKVLKTSNEEQFARDKNS